MRSKIDDDRLRGVVAAIERDTAAMIAPVRERIRRRILAAYWLGVTDTLDSVPAFAERRSRARDS
jgi:hypothetical protein